MEQLHHYGRNTAYTACGQSGPHEKTGSWHQTTCLMCVAEGHPMEDQRDRAFAMIRERLPHAGWSLTAIDQWLDS